MKMNISELYFEERDKRKELSMEVSFLKNKLLKVEEEYRQSKVRFEQDLSLYLKVISDIQAGKSINDCLNELMEGLAKNNNR